MLVHVLPEQPGAEGEHFAAEGAEVVSFTVGIGALDPRDTFRVVPAVQEAFDGRGDPRQAERSRPSSLAEEELTFRKRDERDVLADLEVGGVFRDEPRNSVGVHSGNHVRVVNSLSRPVVCPNKASQASRHGLGFIAELKPR